jgi:hypothetical protein
LHHIFDSTEAPDAKKARTGAVEKEGDASAANTPLDRQKLAGKVETQALPVQ